MTSESVAMAPRLFIYLALAYMIILVFFCHFEPCFSFKSKQLNLLTIKTHWSSAGATWYGSPDGAGSDGNAKIYSKRTGGGGGLNHE